MSRSEATRDLVQLLCIVLAFPALVGLVWDFWPAIKSWAVSPAAPWFMLAAVAAGVAVFVGVLIWGLYRPVTGCQNECCGGLGRERPRG